MKSSIIVFACLLNLELLRLPRILAEYIWNHGFEFMKSVISLFWFPFTLFKIKSALLDYNFVDFSFFM